MAQRTSEEPVEASVTVAIPYHRCPEHIADAVESILAQTHRHLTVVVLNDGDRVTPPWERLRHIEDPRLVRFDLEHNRGRYFADEVTLQATTSPYVVVQDADDWSEPDRVERLLDAVRQHGAGAALSPSVVHDGESPTARRWVRRWQRLEEPVGPRLLHRADHHGLYRAETLRAIGGWHAGFRIGYDTAVLELLAMTTKVVQVDRPLYHRRLRPSSLTSSPTTGYGSATRNAVVAELESLHHAAYERYRSAPEHDTEHTAAAIRALVRDRVPEAERVALADAAARLRTLLG